MLLKKFFLVIGLSIIAVLTGVFGHPKSELNFSLIPETQAVAKKLPISVNKNHKQYVVILMYHHVGFVHDPKNVLDNDLTVSPADFKAQVEYFKNKGYETITVDDIYKSMTHELGLPAKSIVYTFDDGHKDVFDNALPILKEQGMVASLAISTDLLGRPGYAIWDDVVKASADGHEILSHSMNHLDLAYRKYSQHDLQREIFGSKQVLEEKLNKKIDYFVYPYGKYSPKVIGMLNSAGYKMGLTTEFGMYADSEKLLATPRVRVHGQNGLFKLKKIFEPKLVKQTAKSP